MAVLLTIAGVGLVGCKDENTTKIGFSVSDTKKVTFSQGNLQYTRSTNTWSFAENQYDMLGMANVLGSIESYDDDFGKIGTDLADKIDLFGRSGNNTTAPWGISTSIIYHNYSGNFVDWGTNPIGKNAPNTYRTLTKDEWDYLLSRRADASKKKGVARIKTSDTQYANGLILLPDSWTCPAGITFKSGFSNDYTIQAYADYQEFTLAQWQQLEAAGAVFLPTSGMRNGVIVPSEQHYGFYWSATSDDPDDEFLHTSAYYIVFFADEVCYNNFYRFYGQAVRLVKDLE